MPARVQNVAAWIIERHGQAKRLAFFDLGDALLGFGRSKFIHAAELVVGSVVTPR
jgi:hypothetical protein